jgi:hypothetical protein
MMGVAGAIALVSTSIARMVVSGAATRVKYTVVKIDITKEMLVTTVVKRTKRLRSSPTVLI